jgi:hypothetical protein
LRKSHDDDADGDDVQSVMRRRRAGRFVEPGRGGTPRWSINPMNALFETRLKRIFNV